MKNIVNGSPSLNLTSLAPISKYSSLYLESRFIPLGISLLELPLLDDSRGTVGFGNFIFAVVDAATCVPMVIRLSGVPWTAHHTAGAVVALVKACPLAVATVLFNPDRSRFRETGRRTSVVPYIDTLRFALTVVTFEDGDDIAIGGVDETKAEKQHRSKLHLGGRLSIKTSIGP